MNNTQEHVLSLLNSYHDHKRQLSVLEFELEKLKKAANNEYLEMTPKKSLKEIHIHHQRLKEELEFLEYCIANIDKQLSEVVTDLFITRMSWLGTSEKHHVSQTMIQRYRRKGIEYIADMFDTKLQYGNS